jgi:hypothetical protein
MHKLTQHINSQGKTVKLLVMICRPSRCTRNIQPIIQQTCIDITKGKIPKYNITHYLQQYTNIFVHYMEIIKDNNNL